MKLSTMKFEKQTITPAIAKAYLKANVMNRKLRENVVARYAVEMAQGRWKEDTAEVIKIEKGGVILDGQHRLAAIVKANVSVKLHVAKGLDANIIDVLDTGAKRHADDAFMIKGINNSAQVPATIQFWMNFKDGKQGKDLRCSNTVLLEEYYKKDTFWQDVVKISNNWYKEFSKILAPSLIGGLYAYFSEINVSDSERFMKSLCTGNPIENSVILFLRKKLTDDRISLDKKMPQAYKHALIIKTWNAFRKKTDVKYIKYDPLKEDFPTAI